MLSTKINVANMMLLLCVTWPVDKGERMGFASGYIYIYIFFFCHAYVPTVNSIFLKSRKYQHP